MSSHSVTAQAHPNIAFIKYWGNRDDALRLPANGSISMNLEGLLTRTSVSFQPSSALDEFVLNGREMTGHPLERVTALLDLVRAKVGLKHRAEVVSENNFPTGAGIASSASAFAALALAASKAAGLDLSEAELSRLARRGSGSACRSVPGGFVEWLPGMGDEDSFAVSISPSDHWALADCIAMVSAEHKPTGSTEGHALAGTSPLQKARVADAPHRLEVCREAILSRDFNTLAEIIEHDSNLMHAVMMTSHPALFYWEPATLRVMDAIRTWRKSGLQAAYTIDAGPNVHVICASETLQDIRDRLGAISGVSRVLTAGVGGAAQVVK